MKKIVFLTVLLFSSIAFAQQDKTAKERTLTFNEETNLIEVVYYHNNGEISQTGSYTADGKLEGKWISFDKEGNKLVTAFYDNGKKVGKWVYIVNGNEKVVDYTNNVASL